jgi:allantoinase
MAAAPAAMAGLATKGVLREGAAADLVAFAPDETRTVDPAELRHRHTQTPYAGRRLCGVVRRTWLAGQLVADGAPRGRLLSRGRA